MSNVSFIKDEQEVTGRDFILCDICEQPIYREDSMYEGDKYYKINGLVICEECIRDYVKSCGKELSQ